MYVRAGRPAFARPYVEVHRSTSLMSSSLLLQQCPACLVRLTWIVFVMGGRWPHNILSSKFNPSICALSFQYFCFLKSFSYFQHIETGRYLRM